MDKWLKKIINIPNIFLIQVSATPWNCLISLPKEQRVVWETKYFPHNYISRRKLFEGEDDGEEPWCISSNAVTNLKNIISQKSLLLSQFSTNNGQEAVCLLVDYCTSMHEIVTGEKNENSSDDTKSGNLRYFVLIFSTYLFYFLFS